MQNSIMVQTLPPEEFHQIPVQLNFHYIKDLIAKCTELLKFEVQLFQDKECNYVIDSNLSLQQARLNNIIYAKRVNIDLTSSQYPQVTCWFKQDGIELNQGVMLSSDFTFEEVLEEAISKNIIKKMPESIKVTDFYQKQILATLRQMQMCKLKGLQEQDPQLIIHFTTTILEPYVQLQQQKCNPLIQFQQMPFRLQGNQMSLQHGDPQAQQFQIQNFSLQSKPQQYVNFNNIMQIPSNILFKPINNNDFQKSQQISKIQPSENASIQKPLINFGMVQSLNSIQSQQQPQIINKEQSDENEVIQLLENIAIKSVEQIIILGKFSFQINENGNFVTYQCSSPQITGYFLEIKGKKGRLQNEATFKWEQKFGVQIADNLGKGFVIKWKNNTYSSLTIYFM